MAWAHLTPREPYAWKCDASARPECLRRFILPLDATRFFAITIAYEDIDRPAHAHITDASRPLELSAPAIERGTANNSPGHAK